MSWHDHTCKDINLRWHDGVPACDTCGSSALSVIEDPTETPPPPSPPKAPKRSQLKLSWPPCVEYSGPIIDGNGNNVTAFLVDNIDRWEDTFSGQVGLESHEEPATEPAEECTYDGKSRIESSVEADIASRNDRLVGPSWTGRPEHALKTIYGSLSRPDGFRLLYLYGAGSFHAPVHCSLETARLDDPALSTYEALSYTWADLEGDKRNCMPIFIGPQFQVLLVTRNCQSALRSLRTRYDRVLWVDAICINQHDFLERQFQVELMPQLYSTAVRVLIYLGEESDASEKAMRAVAAHSTSQGDGRETFSDLLQRPYFRRIWVIQEIAHAQKASVTCGNETVHWTSLCSAFQSCNLDLTWINHFSSPKRDSRDRPELSRLLIDTRDSDCADPRDRVYGLIGLVHPDEAKLFPIDYSLSVQQVYTGLAAFWAQKLRVSPSLDFLSFACSKKKISGLPSWVPDWSNLSDRQRAAIDFRVRIDVTGISITQCPWGFDATEIAPNLEHFYGDGLTQEFDQSRSFGIGNYDESHTISDMMNFGYHSFAYNIKRPTIQSEAGSLVIDGLPLFRYSQGVLTFAAGHKAGLPIKHSKFDGHPHVLDSEQELEIFYFPWWSEALLLKRHVDSMFSIEGRFFFDLLSFDRGQRTNSEFYELNKACHRIGQQEANLVLSWFASVNFLQKCPFHGLEYFDISKEPFNMIESAAKRRSLANANESPIRNDHLELMKQMRTEMLQSLSPKDVDMFLHPAEIRVRRPLVPLNLQVREQFEEKICESLPRWTWLERQPEDLITGWRQDVTRLKTLVARGCYAETLQSLDYTTYPMWKLEGLFPLRPWHGYCNYIDEAHVLSMAFTCLREASLDDSKSWERNRDQFWICLMSFDLIARLGEFLYHRQVLFLLKESVGNREMYEVVLI